MDPIRRKLLVRLAAVSVVGQSLLSAALLLQIDKLTDRGNFLADIVSRNVDSLEEFDLVALHELGLLKDKKPS